MSERPTRRQIGFEPSYSSLVTVEDCVPEFVPTVLLSQVNFPWYEIDFLLDGDDWTGSEKTGLSFSVGRRGDTKPGSAHLYTKTASERDPTARSG